MKENLVYDTIKEFEESSDQFYIYDILMKCFTVLFGQIETLKETGTPKIHALLERILICRLMQVTNNIVYRYENEILENTFK